MARASARLGIGLTALAVAVLVPSPPLARAASVGLADAKACRKAFNVQGRTYAQKRLALLLGCADKLLECELLAEIDGEDPTACRASATAACAGRLGPQADSALSKVTLRFDAKVGSACQRDAFDYTDVLSTGPGGLWFGNDAACASAIDLPSFLICLRDELDGHVDALVSSVKPRTGLLLDDAGLGVAFPHLVRPPFSDVVVAATAPASGTLVGPGPIVVPAGNALRVTGDAATLGCSGSGSNGRLTVTVGTGPTAQRHSVQEPYGAGAVAIFGPWITPTSVAYTIELKDGSCQDAATGTVTVP